MEVSTDRVRLLRVVEREERRNYAKRFSGVPSGNIGLDLYRAFIDAWTRPVPEDGDSRSCESVPCLYERHYAKGSVAPLHAYLWWLKTGSAVAVSHKIPRLDAGDRKGPFQFSEEELRRMALLVLTTEELEAESLRLVYRMPAGMGWPDRPNTCGRASSTGWIQMADGCLKDDNIDHRLVHELAHHMDYSRSFFFMGHGISNTDEWRSLSGWHLGEMKDKSTGYTVKRDWMPSSGDGYDGFVQDYSRKNPAEDWADSVSFYRADPDALRAVAPRKEAFIASHVFSGQKFDLESRLNQAVEIAMTRLQEPFELEARSCAKDRSLDPAAIESCIGEVAERFSEMSAGQVIDENPGLCGLVTEDAGDFGAKVRAAFADTVKEARSDPALFVARSTANLQYEKELEGLDLSVPVVECFSRSDAPGCFSEKLEQAALSAAKAEWKAFQGSIGKTRSRYLSRTSYENAKRETYQRYRRMFAQALPERDRLARQAWTECSGIDVSAAAPEGEPAEAGAMAAYIHPGIASCLKERSGRPLLEVILRHQPGYPIEDQATRDFLLAGMREEVWASFNSAATDGAKAEEAEIAFIRELAVGPLFSLLAERPDWIRAASPILDSCLGAARKQLESDFPAGVRTRIRAIRYSPQDEVSRNVSDGICAKLSVDPRFKTLFSGGAAAQSLDSTNFLLEAVKTRARSHVKCEQGAIGDLLGRFELAKPETSCALAASATIAKEAFEDWKRSPYGQKFASDTSRLWGFLLRNLTSLIKAVTEEE